jgi:uncharacterized protein (TIGR03435 family)
MFTYTVLWARETALIKPRLCIGLLATCCLAQTPSHPDRPYHFEVAVIKPSKSDEWAMGMTLKDGTLTVRNLYLKSLITSAYGVREGLITGLPTWAHSARFDIVAKIPEEDREHAKEMTREERRALMAGLLSTRFRLQAHTISQIRPLYFLEPVKGGPLLRESQVKDNVESPPDVNARTGHFVADSAPISYLSSFLAECLDKEVIDHTALSKRYEIRLKWTPETTALDAPSEPDTSIFTALREQLGLVLRPSKGPVNILVIDQIDHPTPN